MNNSYSLSWVRILPAVFLVLFAITGINISATAQQYGNEWINYSQPYYKFQVAKDGIHRITHADLTALGITSADPRKFQLFRRGQEVAIYVAGQGDGTLDPSDYIEFYGQRNDGKLDAELYKTPAHQVHTYYSLYTDTSAYFLTISPTTNGKRMVEQNILTTGLTPEPFHYKERMILRTDSYGRGRSSNIDSFNSWMDQGEGFFANYTAGIQNFSIDSVINVNTSGHKPVLEIALVGYPALGRYVDHDVDVFILTPAGGTRLLGNPKFPMFEHKILRYQIEFSDIFPNGTVQFRYVPKGTMLVGTVTFKEILRFAYAKVIFPQNSVFNNKSAVILTDSSKTTSSYFLAQNPPANAVAFDITDPNNIIRIEGYSVSSTEKGFVIPAPASAGNRRKVLIANPNSFLSPAAKTPVGFRQITPANHNFVIISNKVLTKPHQNYTNPPKDYAAYKASAAGGSFDTVLVMMDQLYNQFHYGERSSAAITRFMKFMMDNGSPQYLLLLGKGLEPDFGGPTPHQGGGYRKNPSAYTLQDLVPTGGAPGSDIIFTADWKNGFYHPRVPTGRIPAVTSADIVSYLEKIKMHDTLGVAEWRKNFLHLGGGQTQTEIITFRNFLNNYKRKAEGPLLGARVFSKFRENSINIIEKINVSAEVNRGLSLITFFGHSSPNVTDIDIGLVSDPVNGYNNFGKYPMILMNGCNSGNAFSTGSFGENWMLTPNKGSLLFLAHSSFGFEAYLNVYSDNFYKTAFTDSAYYGKSVGEIQAQTIRETVKNRSSLFPVVAMATEMVLQGDPSVRLYSPEKPDYAISNNTLFIQPINESLVTAKSDSFRIGIPVKNLGKAIVDSFYVSVTRRFAGSIIETVDSVMAPPVYNHDTVFVTMQMASVNAIGLNTFDVHVDHTNKIDELNEFNNTGTFEYFFPQSGVVALLPSEFSIVNTPTVKLVGQSTDMFIQNKDYYFEIDTTHHFNSPFRKTNIVANAGMLPVWNNVQLLPVTPANDSIVYYWRLRFNDFGPGEDTVWAESSFRHIPSSPGGWSQSEFAQFNRNQLKEIAVKEQSPNWNFTQFSKDIRIRTVGGALPFTYPPNGIFVNEEVLFNSTFCGFGNPGMIAIVFNANTLIEEDSVGAKGKYPMCGNPARVFHFGNLTTAANQTRLTDFLNDIRPGYYVAMVSMNNTPFSTFTPALKTAFESIGSNLINTLQTGHPFAIVGRKGAAPGSVAEATFNPNLATPADSQTVVLDHSLLSALQSGEITSTRIGPATEWKTLYHTVRKQASDRYRLSLVGYDKQGNQTVLQPDVASTAFSLANIDANTYPYLQLVMSKSDSANRTAPQLKEWMITYDGVPEGVVRPDIAGIGHYDISAKLAQAREVTVPFAFHNISDKNFADSITAVVRIVGPTSNLPADSIKLKQLMANDTVQFNYTFDSRGMKGSYRLRVNFNPQLLPEQYFYNNTMEVPFTVNSSDLHPILDVMFDGVHIMDGDIVSPSPEISIALKDEDKVKFTENPEDIQIFMRYLGPNGDQNPVFQEINMATNSADIQFFKGDINKEARLVYNPKNLADGIYELQVQGKDVSENLSGTNRYSISFRVINESTITHFYPYPNPFTTSTRFVFTLTGSVIPQNLKIQIMTVTGKVVREITGPELGPIRIGNNTSAYSWNGTDEFGDKLANGVYLYRVVIDHGPDEMKHRRTSGDKAFKNNWGKLYILR